MALSELTDARKPGAVHQLHLHRGYFKQLKETLDLFAMAGCDALQEEWCRSTRQTRSLNSKAAREAFGASGAESFGQQERKPKSSVIHMISIRDIVERTYSVRETLLSFLVVAAHRSLIGHPTVW